jgi:hypothetical protein
MIRPYFFINLFIHLPKDKKRKYSLKFHIPTVQTRLWNDGKALLIDADGLLTGTAPKLINRHLQPHGCVD